MEKHADADSIFVYMDLTVTNLSHKGSAFIPQNTLKRIIGDNAFDAEDLDGGGGSSLSNRGAAPLESDNAPGRVSCREQV